MREHAFKAFMDASSKPWMEQKEGINRLGSFTGVMAQAGQVTPDVEPNAADRKSAERLGQRIANATRRWAKSA